jgi:hypothetical protein
MKTRPEKKFYQHLQDRQPQLRIFQLRNMRGYSINKSRKNRGLGIKDTKTGEMIFLQF